MADGCELLCCPCGQKAIGIRCNSVTLTCCECNVKWHSKCVGLGGMSSKEACKYSEWVCPSCFVMPGDCESDLGSSSLQDQNKTEVLRVLPVVVTTVVKQTEVFAARTYASVTKEFQNEFVHKCIEQSSSMAVEKGFQRIEDDIAQKDRRKRNIVIRVIRDTFNIRDTLYIRSLLRSGLI